MAKDRSDIVAFPGTTVTASAAFTAAPAPVGAQRPGAGVAAAYETLATVALHRPLQVVQVHAAAAAAPVAQQLLDLGFLPGERVSVLAHGWPGADPLVVRIGDATFALRRAEAACVEVAPVTEGPAHGARHA